MHKKDVIEVCNGIGTPHVGYFTTRDESGDLEDVEPRILRAYKQIPGVTNVKGVYSRYMLEAVEYDEA